MTDFYTNVSVSGSKILYRGIENGRRVRKRVDFTPTLFVLSQTPTKYKTIQGNYVKEINPGSIKDCRDFVRQYDNVSNFPIYGNQKYEYVFISDQFPGPVEWDRSLINVANIDIEVGSENGFPEPATASEPVTAITIKTTNKFVVLACGEFINNREDVQYIKCSDEIDLLKRFIDIWTGDYPDVITGWNVKFFDIPYLVNRITKLLGENFAKRISPWGYITARETILMGKAQATYVISGIGVFDYIELYRKFASGGMSVENYRLDTICAVEINERKLSYEEYGNLHRLYKDNFQKFIEYNIRDVDLVDKLDDKLKLIDLALTLAYDSKSNFDDVFMQVRMWDNLIYNHLHAQNIVLPPNETHTKSTQYVGAYVKDPQPGMYKWIASFDLNSLYPHLIQQYNISPDTFIEPESYTDEMRAFLCNNISVDTLLKKEINTKPLKSMNVTLTPNGQFFGRNKIGFLPKMMEEMYNDRTNYKNKAKDAKKDLEKETDPHKRFEIEKRIARYNNLQLAKKVCLNSAYGSLGSEYFRFFDIRQASAITTAGQLAIQWIEQKLNVYLGRILGEEKDYAIAADTDSVYLNLDDLVHKSFEGSIKPEKTKQVISFMDKVCETKLQPFIDKSYNELAQYTNAVAQKMQMKREALADRGLWTAKKRYVLNVHNNEGIEYATPKIKVTGLEMIKSSTPAACRKKLWEALDIIMNKDEDTMIDFIETFREDFKKQPIPDIAFPRGVNGISNYSDSKTLFAKGTPIHVRGSIMYNHILKVCGLEKSYPTIHEGEKIKFIYLKEPNIIRSNVISFPLILPKEFGLEKYIDYNLQFEKSFLEPLKVLLDLVGWKTEKTISLMDYCE